MHLEFLVEEPSAEVALALLVPKIVPGPTFAIRTFRGKQDLLNNLPNRLRGYRQWLPNDWRIVVLIDEDRQDCRQLKIQLENSAQDAGLLTRSAVQGAGQFHVLNRLAIEELEAWFFGDVEAIVAAYPGVPPTLGRRERYRHPDAINGGTWEALERVLQSSGYYKGGLQKITVAQDISSNMDPVRNRSPSFQLFRDSLIELVR